MSSFPCSGDWPVSEQDLTSFLDRCSVGMGVANRMGPIRWRAREQLFIPDMQHIPDSEVFVKRFACHECHVGLCAARDSGIYDDALKLSVSLERFFVGGKVGGFFRIGDPESEGFAMIVYFCMHRARRPFAQTTHAFAPLIEVPGRPAGCFMLQELGEEKRHLYLSVWSIAKELLKQGLEQRIVAQAGLPSCHPFSFAPSHVAVITAVSCAMRVLGLRLLQREALPHRNLIDGTVAFELHAKSLGAGVELWPELYRAPRRPKLESDTIDGLPAPRRRMSKPKCRRGGGIQVVVEPQIPRNTAPMNLRMYMNVCYCRHGTIYIDMLHDMQPKRSCWACGRRTTAAAYAAHRGGARERRRRLRR